MDLIRRAWSNLWLRAGVLNPLILIGPTVILSWLAAAPADSDIDIVGWGLWAVIVGAGAVFVCGVVIAARHPEVAAGPRFLIMVCGAAGAGAGFLAGFYLWLLAAERACHGGYECPF